MAVAGKYDALPVETSVENRIHEVWMGDIEVLCLHYNTVKPHTVRLQSLRPNYRNKTNE